MKPAVPDPTVEALRLAGCSIGPYRVAQSAIADLDREHIDVLEVGRILSDLRRDVSKMYEDAARAAAPDALRDRIQALCDAAMRNNYHPGAANVSVPVADLLAVLEEDA